MWAKAITARHAQYGGRPIFAWPRELPIDSEPKDVAEVVEGHSRWLAESEIPKLFVNAEPG